MSTVIAVIVGLCMVMAYVLMTAQGDESQTGAVVKREREMRRQRQ